MINSPRQRNTSEGQENTPPLDREGLLNIVSSKPKLLDFLADKGIDPEDEGNTEALRQGVEGFTVIERYINDQEFSGFLLKIPEESRPEISPDNAESLEGHFFRFQKLKEHKKQIIKDISEKYRKIGVPVPDDAKQRFETEITEICANSAETFDTYVTQYEEHIRLEAEIKRVKAEIGELGEGGVEGAVEASEERIRMLENAGKVSALDQVRGWAGRAKRGFKEEDLDEKITEKKNYLSEVSKDFLERGVFASPFFTAFLGKIYKLDKGESFSHGIRFDVTGFHTQEQLRKIPGSNKVLFTIDDLFMHYYDASFSQEDKNVAQKALEHYFPGLIKIYEKSIDELKNEIKEIEAKKKQKEDIEKAKAEGLSVSPIKRIFSKAEGAKKTVAQALAGERDRKRRLDLLKSHSDRLDEAREVVYAQGGALTNLYDSANKAVSDAMTQRLNAVTTETDLGKKEVALKNLNTLRKKVSEHEDVTGLLFEEKVDILGSEIGDIEDYEQAVSNVVKVVCEEKVAKVFEDGAWASQNVTDLTNKIKLVINSAEAGLAREERKKFILDIIDNKINVDSGDARKSFRLKLLKTRIQKI